MLHALSYAVLIPHLSSLHALTLLSLWMAHSSVITLLSAIMHALSAAAQLRSHYVSPDGLLRLAGVMPCGT